MQEATDDLPDGIEPDQVADSKAEAIENDRTYFKGSPCRAEGHRIRYVSSGSCLVCTRSKSRARKRREKQKKDDGSFEERTGPFTGEYLPDLELDVLSACFLYAVRTQMRERVGYTYTGYFPSEVRALQAFDGSPPPDEQYHPGDPVPAGYEYLPGRSRTEIDPTALAEFEPWEDSFISNLQDPL